MFVARRKCQIPNGYGLYFVLFIIIIHLFTNFAKQQIVKKKYQKNSSNHTFDAS